MTEARRRRLPIRLTGVLVVLVLGALGLALVSGGSPDDTPASATTDPEPVDVPPEVVAAAVDRITSIEQPLTVWLEIADCESGEWDAQSDPQAGSARWAYGTRESTRFEGGLHFAPQTWDAFRDPNMPDHAGQAVPVAQIVVAERVLDDQGWQAWPVCSEKIGVRDG